MLRFLSFVLFLGGKMEEQVVLFGSARSTGFCAYLFRKLDENLL